MISLLMAEWSHLIDDNLHFFAPRFTLYRNAISSWIPSMSSQVFLQMELSVNTIGIGVLTLVVTRGSTAMDI